MKTTKKNINLSISGFLEIANSYRLPEVDGSFGFVMATDGIGGVTWVDPGTLALDTDDITEASNLYFTNERVDDRVSSLILNGTGISWTYNDVLNTLVGNVSLAPFSTTNLAEGINLYFTNERVDDRVASLLQNGTGISWSYNDISNTLTPTISLSPFNTDNLAEGTINKYFTTEAIDDRVAVLIKNGTGLTWTYNDPANSFTGNVSLSPFSTTNLAEGTNLYFTNERVDDRVSSLIINSSSINWTYNDIANTLEATAVAQPITVKKAGSLVSSRSILNFIEGPNTTINIIDNGGTLATDITISSTGGGSNPGTLYDILSNGVSVGDLDIEHLNFSDKFMLVESPDKYITVDVLLLLSELADVDATTPSDGDILIYNGSPGMWVSSPPPPSLGGVVRTWTWSAASKSTSTNVYLKGNDGSFTNKSPYIVPFNCKLTAISASTDSAYTWNAEVHVNGINVGSLSIFASDSGYASPLNISINAGDKISFYCNGTAIKGPNITAWFNEL